MHHSRADVMEEALHMESTKRVVLGKDFLGLTAPVRTT